MIYDRTISDVEAAVSIRADKVQKGMELTERDIETLERGFVTVNTLNRIESAQSTLKNDLNRLGYYNIPIVNKTWRKEQILKKSELERIVANLSVLRNAFFVCLDTPATPKAEYHYANFNDVEKILYDIGVMINDVESYSRECGMFECGEE